MNPDSYKSVIIILQTVLALLHTPNLPVPVQQKLLTLESATIMLATNSLPQQPINQIATSTSTSAPAQSNGSGSLGAADSAPQSDQTSTPPVTAPAATTTVPTSTPQQVTVVAPTSSTPVQPAVKTIPVSFATTTDGEAWITVKDTLAETIIIKNIIVPSSTLTGFALDTVNPQTFRPATPGYYVTLTQGEFAVLRYEGDPVGITYDSHSIEGTDSGYDIQF